MQEILTQKLHHYIIHNNVDLLISLQQERRVTQYLREKVASADGLLSRLQEESVPAYIIEEVCLDFLTEDLKPSRFNYISAILEEEFKPFYEKLRDSGVLTYEIINLIELCAPLFDVFGFSEQQADDSRLRYAVTGATSDYFNKM